MWCQCVSDALVHWSGLFLLSPRVCSQHGSSSNIGRFACFCLYEWQRVSIMLLSLRTEAGWLFSSRWDHGSVGSTLIQLVDKNKKDLKNFHWHPTLSVQAVSHVWCVFLKHPHVIILYSGLLLAQNGASEISLFLFYYWYKFRIFSWKHPIRPTEHYYQDIKKSKPVKGFDVFIV